ncbi:Glutamate dehydrogenase [Moorella glycerini]|uniref:Glutamate dehydrogenase n=1 Tax=Neomoorella stamsii TaxID=1266720 RepID=A0A9X7J028_9FIRM|nr:MULTISPECIES: Glu/Leu/Phe/Val dehydrogenase [Moorella]PRR68868.1 Glutamate dehydrogenase [Moorella stamsii]CEP67489.1 Glutamate dehydrogenase [Moorella glycerini]
MSNNPFETALNSLFIASRLADLDPNVVEILSKPKRIFEFTIPFKMDNGEFKLFTAYRVHYNDALGPVKDGTRFAPDLDLDTVKALGLWMTIKHAVAGIPAGGGKGGIRVNPAELSERELERLTRAYIRKLPLKGAWIDIPGADIGTSGKTQAWMLDEFEEIMGYHSPAAINDKPVEVNGTQGSAEATGTGAFYVTMQAVKDFGISQNASVAIQGFGTVGRMIASLLYKEGFKILAVSDIYGGVYSAVGLNIEKLALHVAETGSVVNFQDAESITNNELLELPCDVLVPAAVQSVITVENANKINARLIIECANGPVTHEAEKILEGKGTIIIPDVLANCGSAIVCSFERIQGLTDDYWDLETVLHRLRERILKAYQETYQVAMSKDISLRNAAWVNALVKLARAIEKRGWV